MTMRKKLWASARTCYDVLDLQNGHISEDVGITLRQFGHFLNEDAGACTYFLRFDSSLSILDLNLRVKRSLTSDAKALWAFHVISIIPVPPALEIISTSVSSLFIDFSRSVMATLLLTLRKYLSPRITPISSLSENSFA